MKTIYKIKIINWEKYNPNHKKNFKSMMIPNNFIHDAKLRAMPLSHRWMWLGVLLTCSDHARDEVEFSERQLRDLLESSKSIESVLDLFQSIQLLKYEKSSPNRIERIEKKRIEKNRTSDEVEPPPSPVRVEIVEAGPSKKERTEANKRVWEAYKEAYLVRWKVEPVRNLTVNSQIASLVKRLGEEDAISVVKFYLSHNDGFYVRSTHPVGLCLKDCESLRTQMLRGKAITRNDVRNFEKVMNTQDTLTALRNGEV